MYEHASGRHHNYSAGIFRGRRPRFCIVTPRRDELLSRGLHAHGAAALDAREPPSRIAPRWWSLSMSLSCETLQVMMIARVVVKPMLTRGLETALQALQALLVLGMYA